MAIVLEANYAKKLGLPGYSSHQYSVSIRTELTDLSQVEQESSRLYRLLQDSVDQSIQEVGFMPDAHTYGTATNGAAHPGNNEFWADGVRPVGHRVLAEILTQAFKELGINNTSIAALLK